MILTRRAQVLMVLVLLLTCIVFFYIFQGILPYYFSGRNNLHIIDIHVMRCGVACLFDSDYISNVRKAYNAERYTETFFLVDLLFPIIYTSLFLVLSYAFWNRKWNKWLLLVFIAGMMSDLGENGAFLYYLYHPGNTAATVTAICTSIKSLLFPVNFGLSLVLFTRGLRLPAN